MLKTNAFDASASDSLSVEKRDMIERRRRLLGPAYQLFYKDPLHLVRGDGVWVFDAEGRHYLDVYNNVPSVGHCHPHVLEALTRQASELNTHTRYLHDNVLDFAEKLIGTMPSALSQVMFTCTGSEANDLALRIAEDYTGGTGVIVTDYSYHGMTKSIAALSASMGPYVKLDRDARAIPAPVHDPINPETVGKRFAADVRAAITDMRRHGIKPAALLIDTFFTSDGGFFDPPGFLQEAVDVIREAGGLYIADEVQPGYGRSGEHMWGFQRHGLVPDLVTLGKPMGNGHPMAATVVKPHILERFGSESSYFNTFAGNTVSAAVGLAVLEVIERENLLPSIQRAGKVIVDGIVELATRHPAIGSVRGVGLYASVDFVTPEGQPDPETALRVVNDLRDEGILIGASGPHSNVLKIRPPLVFTEVHSRLLVEGLEKVLSRH
ncbi:aspartate aminotransferase family protein [Chromohalobacter nigrandesensis]|uniref:aspartate aminotransferase family protein n=1 Tax=Chromohalobacter nigrandesensis TaxID=119863 RepID=UPI001FF29E27|nr:aminotransferase class III-fold pyridoxal phosphate-dependent enzyme [Chromohalobacter nigrandesensis]MCK0744204.1 aminotransferase class III-fold pyridoxal phosphate-dependent enzyme [Chromohalobacter nigrandesensis]